MAGPRRQLEVLDLIGQGIIETTADGEILLVNAAFARLLGYESPQDLLSCVTGAAELYSDPVERTGEVGRAARGTADDSHAVQVRCKDGRSTWVHARVVPTLADDGTLERMTAILDEVEDHPITQRALDGAAQRIEAHERALLAEAVHDEPLQLIAAAILRLDSLHEQVTGPEAVAVDVVVTILDQSMEQLRRLIVSLSPPDFEGGLGLAVLGVAEGIFLDGRTAVELRGPQHVPLPNPVKSLAYLVLREALINVRKHARAGRVVIETDVRPDAVLLSVTDDGRGADSISGSPGHLGLSTMRARARSIGADLDIRTRPGEGTTVRLRVPRVDRSGGE